MSYYLYIHCKKLSRFWHEMKSKNHSGREKKKYDNLETKGNGIRFLTMYILIVL